MRRSRFTHSEILQLLGEASAGVPVAGGNVTIPTGKTVELDIATPALNRITVNGTLLAAPDQDVALTARDIWVYGTLRAGSESES